MCPDDERSEVSIDGKAADPIRVLSVVVPARNEAESLPPTVQHLHLELTLHKIDHEIIVVDDGSVDSKI